jgi:hypothetical protein
MYGLRPDTIADEYSRQRITWLMDTMGHSEMESCYTVVNQFPKNAYATPTRRRRNCPTSTRHSAHPALSSNASDEQMPGVRSKHSFVLMAGVRVGALSIPGISVEISVTLLRAD